MILWIKLIGRSLCLGLCRTATYFLSASGQKKNSPSVFATGSVRYSCVPASRGAYIAYALIRPWLLYVSWQLFPLTVSFPTKPVMRNRCSSAHRCAADAI
jgi:hypothetical protein